MRGKIVVTLTYFPSSFTDLAKLLPAPQCEFTHDVPGYSACLNREFPDFPPGLFAVVSGYSTCGGYPCSRSILVHLNCTCGPSIRSLPLPTGKACRPPEPRPRPINNKYECMTDDGYARYRSCSASCRPSTRSNHAPPVARVGYASSRRVAASVNLTLRHLNASARPHAALERVQGAANL